MELIAGMGAIWSELVAAKIVTNAIVGKLVTAAGDSGMVRLFTEHFLYDYGLYTSTGCAQS